MTRNVYVIAKIDTSDDDVEDPDAEGAWLVTLTDDCPPQYQEEAALEAFHEGVCIGNLEQFSIYVVDENGERLEGQSMEDGIRDAQPLDDWGDLAGCEGPADMFDKRSPSPAV